MNNKPVLEVCLSPALLHLFDLKETIVVIIDIFRATSTICAALDNGAKAVIPIASVDECLSINEELNCLTAGERDGKVIEGLKHGNSPLEYNRELIEGKTLYLTTTNGTKLLHLAKDAEQIIIGSFLNLDAVCSYLVQSGKKVLLACSAWKDRINIEDSLFAGAVVDQIKDHFMLKCDSTIMAHSLFLQSKSYASILDSLKMSSHYSRLSGFGLQKDLAYCTTLNLHPVLPVFNGKELIVDYEPVKIMNN